MEKNVVLIAGGSGFLGKEIENELGKTAEVRILTRNKNPKPTNHFYWNPELEEIDEQALVGVSHIINLCGAPLMDKRWSKSRKLVLLRSRIEPTKFIFSKRTAMPGLKQYISASGINCYPTEDPTKTYTEEDEMGKDYVSELVKSWEDAADLFQDTCAVVKLRISFVMAENGGSLELFEKPIKKGFALILGKGTQAIPWIHITDLTKMVSFCIAEHLAGIYHANAGNITNADLTKLVARKYKKKVFLPHVPAFVLKLVLGERSFLVLKGIQANSNKIERAGFVFTKKTCAAFLK